MVGSEEKEDEMEDKGIQESIAKIIIMTDKLGEIELENFTAETNVLDVESLKPVIEVDSITLPDGALGLNVGGGIKIILKGVKIYGEKVIIKKMEKTK